MSKQDILQAYKELSLISPNPTLQGATQKVSAIRYAIALDMFCHKRAVKECDTRSKEDKELFIACVGDVCSVASDLYTPNFYYPLKQNNGDYNVGSNFFSVGQVKVSLADPTSTLEYPKRGNVPLFFIKNGVLIRDTSLYSNLRTYLDSDKAKAALTVWIARNHALTAAPTTFDSIKAAVTHLLSFEMCEFLMPDTHNFKHEISSIITSPFASLPATIEEEDIAQLFTTKGEVSFFPNKYRQYITAIKTKPFLLLAGISGTGKSRIVREMARACWDVGSEEHKAQKPKNFEMVQVKPNWHDSSELLGYVSRINGERFIVGPLLKFMAQAMQEPDVPHFLCLDEMNLAPVEQYFAEYLSVMESRRRAEDGTITTDPIVDFEPTDAYHSLIVQLFDDEAERRLFLTKEGGKRLTIPQNLIVVGTVNMDETTFSFSRKVLDRAMTVEMNEVNLWSGLKNRYEPIGKQSKETLIGEAVEAVDIYESHKEVCDICLDYLEKVNAELERTPFKVAYRTRNEVLLYVVNNLQYNKAEDGGELPREYVIAKALDEVTSMKILSRIEGDESRVSKGFLDSLSATIKEGLSLISGRGDGAEGEPKEEPISLAKLEEMAKRLAASGYTSYWS